MKNLGGLASRFLSLTAVLIIISGCGTVKVPINLTHPAEINMSQYTQIAISDIKGNMGQSFSEGLKNRLIESNRFKVVDRNRMNLIMKELKLSQSDLSDSGNAIKLGKLMSASALIAGHTEGCYKEKTSSSKGTCYKNKKKIFLYNLLSKRSIFYQRQYRCYRCSNRPNYQKQNIKCCL